MKQSKTILLLIMIVVLVALIMMPRSHVTDYEAKTQLVEVLTFDLQEKEKLVDADVLNGEAAVISLETKSNNIIAHDYNLLKNFAIMQQFDGWSDGKIDPTDQLYHQLRLLILSNDGENITSTPIEKAGIRIIFLYREFLTKLVNNNISSDSEIVGYAVLSDGSKRIIYAQRIPEYYFKRVKSHVRND